jgi:hypothetical protein
MRITRPQLWMGMAEIAAQRATCFRGSCGAILVKDNDVVSIGYNGPPSGEEHCQGNDCVLTATGRLRQVAPCRVQRYHQGRKETPLPVDVRPLLHLFALCRVRPADRQQLSASVLLQVRLPRPFGPQLPGAPPWPIAVQDHA